MLRHMLPKPRRSEAFPGPRVEHVPMARVEPQPRLVTAADVALRVDPRHEPEAGQLPVQLGGEVLEWFDEILRRLPGDVDELLGPQPFDGFDFDLESDAPVSNGRIDQGLVLQVFGTDTDHQVPAPTGLAQ